MPSTGKVSQVIGSTFDAEFPEDQLPSIYNALVIDTTTSGLTATVIRTDWLGMRSHCWLVSSLSPTRMTR